MDAPKQIAEIVLQILEDSLLAVRFAAWHNNAKLAAIEASHIHNLPQLLRDYDQEKLDWYWNGQRSAYLEEFIEYVGSGPKHFADCRQRLEPLVPQDKPSL